MPTISKFQRGVQMIDLSKAEGPSDATVVGVPLPKGTIGIVFGQRTADYAQRYNTYIVDDDSIVREPQVVWDALTENSRFEITKIVPSSYKPPITDPNVMSVGPFEEDLHIAVHLSHKGPNDTEYKESIPQHDYHDFLIGGKNAISFTMINGEDGADKDNHDTVVGVAVVYTTK
ncbi:hypothetical protein M413DRAFT_28554 [Hebeloma cylindrosporum]|uniref:Uncharacterized protein n=1 Tax=Hebeloma cylindrosporum TaxID=76867 RepID=A0A0C3C9A8_HEBCY|nr:hypothetical protein M413DRAFT_28554 [Hebeloma cylindrosporum h7]